MTALSLYQHVQWNEFHTSQIKLISISSEGTFIASAGDDGTVLIFDSATGRALHSTVFDGAMRPQKLVWIGETILVLGCLDGLVATLNITSRGEKLDVGRPEWLPHHFPGSIEELVYEPKSRSLIVAYGGVVERWTHENSEWLANCQISPMGAASTDEVIGLWAIDETRILAAFDGQGIVLWTLDKSVEIIPGLEFGDSMLVRAALSNDRKFLALSTVNEVHLYHLTLAPSPKLRRLASWSDYDQARLSPILLNIVPHGPHSSLVFDDLRGSLSVVALNLTIDGQALAQGDAKKLPYGENCALSALAVHGNEAKQQVLTATEALGDGGFQLQLWSNSQTRGGPIIVNSQDQTVVRNLFAQALSQAIRRRRFMAAIRQYLGLAQLAFILHLSPYVIRVVGDYRMWSMPKLTVRRKFGVAVFLVCCWLLYLPKEGAAPKYHQAVGLADAVSALGSGMFNRATAAQPAPPKGFTLFARAFWKGGSSWVWGIVYCFRAVLGFVWSVVGLTFAGIIEAVCGVFRGLGALGGSFMSLLGGSYSSLELMLCTYVEGGEGCGHLARP